MRVQINGVPLPHVCEKLADPSNCAAILEHCKATDSQAECVARMFGEATLNSIQSFPDEAYNKAFTIFHFVMPYGHKYLHSLVDTIIKNGFGGGGDSPWRVF